MELDFEMSANLQGTLGSFWNVGLDSRSITKEKMRMILENCRNIQI